jgi:type VI secretion system secreted protein VgrG
MSTWSPSNLQALLGELTDDTRLLQLSTPLGGRHLVVECVRGEEGIGQGFRFQLGALASDVGIAPETLIGQPALLQLVTAGDGEQRRPFHGHITGVELSGNNDGLSRYHLTLEPWTAFLARGRDSRVFQNMTVFDILDCVFAPWQGKGRLAPSWRFDIGERATYPARSLTTQYRESDLAFVERLMKEAGLFHYFEHTGTPDSPALGSHTLVIADHNCPVKATLKELAGQVL